MDGELAMANLTISDTHSHEGTAKLAEIELHSTGKWEPGRTLSVPGQVWAQVQCTACIIGDYTTPSLYDSNSKVGKSLKSCVSRRDLSPFNVPLV